MIEDAKKILKEELTASSEAFNNLQQNNIKATAQYDKCNTALEHLMSVTNRLKSTATTGDSNLIKVSQEALLDAVNNVQTESDKLRQIILLPPKGGWKQFLILEKDQDQDLEDQ